MNKNILDFYTVNEKYIEYISKYDKHIAYNKTERRPYVGIILEINNLIYFAPMFSPKIQHKKYKSNLSFLKIYGNTERTDYLELIRFSDMIPVPLTEINIVTHNSNNKYDILMNKQYEYINQIDRRNLIRTKAIRLYNIVCSNKESKTTKFYKNLSCNFKLLEEKYKEYNF